MRRTNRAVQTIPLLLLAGALSGLASCSGGDTAEKAVKDADLEFRRVSAGSAALPDRVAKEAFDNSAAMTREFAGSDETFGDAAAVSLAMSKLGQASVSVDEATNAHTTLSHKIRVIHAHVSEWITLDGVARASSSVSVDQDTATMRELIELRRDDVEAYEAERQAMQREIQALDAQIAQLEERAAEEREKAAEFELRMRSLSATESAQLAERVREHTLRADALELESIRIAGIVGQKRPAAKEIELQVLMAQNQIKLLESSIDELETRVRDAQQDAREAREDAAQALASIKSLVEDAEDYNESTVMPANESVIRTIRDAASTARQARASSKVSGAHALSSAQQMLARSYSRQSRGEALLTGLYRALSASGIPGDWDTPAQSHDERAQELRQSANESFQDAAGSLRRGRSPGGSSEARDSAAERLESLGGVEPEPVEDNPDIGDSEDAEG